MFGTAPKKSTKKTFDSTRRRKSKRLRNDVSNRSRSAVNREFQEYLNTGGDPEKTFATTGKKN